MQKILSIWLSVAILFSVLVPSVFAQESSLTLQIVEESVYEEGDFQLSISVENVNNLIGAGFDVLFPIELIKYSKVEQGPFLSSDKNRLLMTANEREGKGIVHFGISRTGDVQGISGSGIIATFHFKALKQATEAKIDLSNIMLLDPANIEIKVAFEALVFEINEKDIIPPELTIEEVEPTYFDNAVIKGSTEVGATLTIDGKAIEVAEDGTFSHEVTLKAGENKFKVIATDRAGNETKIDFVIIRKDPVVIKLVIGSKKVLVNNQSKEIEAAPFVDKASGRTLVPIRIVTESIGAGIAWDASDRRVTIKGNEVTIELWIDKPIANINGIPTPIDVQAPSLSPKIVAGRTVLPLRFVADNLGCTVGWDGATQTITLTYPKVSS
jgi:hypothetical protein